jgi:hypothetical protein
MRRSRFTILVYRSNEAIASPGDGLDVFAAVRSITQHLPEVEDVPGQIAFLNENTRPDFFKQLFLFDDVPRPLDQNEEGFQVLWREGDGLAIPQQYPLQGVEAVRAESV